MNEAELAAGLAKTSNYCYATRVGNQLYVAGQVPLDVNNNIVGVDNPSAQAKKCLENLQTLLDLHHFDNDDIQQIVVYVVGDRASLVKAWTTVEKWFDNQVPPATLLGVSCLGHQDQLVEIDATVIKG